MAKIPIKIKKSPKKMKMQAKGIKIKKKDKKMTKKSNGTVSNPKPDYGTMSVENFFDNFDEIDNSDSELEEQINDEEDSLNGTQPEEESDNEFDGDGELGSENEDEAEKHKRDLEKLKDTDPEFYNFLQENDKKLLQFNLSDEEVEEDEDESEEIHKPDGNLEVASDESDFEGDEDEPKDNRKITLKLLKTWQRDVQTDKSNKTIIALTQAFHAALLRVSNPEESEEESVYKVEGSTVFNAVIQICVLDLGPAIRRYLGLTPGTKQPPHKCKKFNKIKGVLKSYFTDLLKLLTGVTSSNIQTVLLKHLHYMTSLLVSFPHITKSLIKQLIKLWGTSDETVRVIAFFCILRITNNQSASVYDTVLKSMYMTYIKNSKFVSLNSLAGINFMRRSLVEILALDANVAYQHVFLYIRQLAIHLRNAITVNKKENLQAVYNWQFVNSLRLWGNLLAVTYNKPHLQQLIYPFVQICLGTIKLVPTAQYYPLRFHVVEILNDLSKETGIFIPTLPFLLEVLTSYDFNKKHQKISMKPLQFTCLLRLSKSQLQENGFKDSVIETIYGQLLEYLTNQSHSLAFPDLALLATIHIKQFLKKCRNVNYNRKLKQVLEKIDQNSQFIEKEREKLTINLTDFKQLEGFESQIRNKGTPLMAYYESWNKLRQVKKNKLLTNNDELADYKLPKLKRREKKEKEVRIGPVELFPSDEDDDDDENVNKDGKTQRGKRGGKNVKKQRVVDASGPVEDDGKQDIVQDINISDW